MEFTFAVGLLWGLLTFAVLYSISYYQKRASYKVPGPFEWPFFGHFFLIQRRLFVHADLFDFVLSLHKKYGRFFTFQFPTLPRYILTTDPDTLVYVLKTNFENYAKGPNFHTMFYEFLGNGIFNADGQTWKLQRQTASHLFTVKELKGYVELFSENTLKMVDLFGEQLSDDGSKKVVDIQDILQRFTLDSITKIAFGVEAGSLRIDTPFSKAFDYCNEAVALRNLNPFIVKYPWLFPSERKFAKTAQIVDQFAYDIIRKRKEDTNIEGRGDLLSRYLSMKDDNGNPFTDLYLRDITVNFLLAGRDTTSQLLTWTLYLLSQNPEAENRALEEIQTTLNGSEPNYENTKNMKYLKAVLDETLRLYPPVPFERKEAVNDDQFPNGIIIPKGTNVLWNLYGMGRLEEFYDEPLTFKPERWFSDTKSNAFIPFLYGPRTCLGQQMAYTQTKIVLCHLLQKFRFVHVPNHVVTYDSTFITLRAKYGMHMYLYART